MGSYLREREMRTMVKDMKSEWRIVDSGVLQGSVLAPILFLVNINDMQRMSAVRWVCLQMMLICWDYKKK